MLEAEDHADDVEHFQDYVDPRDPEGNAEDDEGQHPAQQSMRNTAAQRAQQSSSVEEEVKGADSSSEEEVPGPSQQQQQDSSDSEEEETLGAVNQDMEPSTKGRSQMPGTKAESHAGDMGLGVKLMGGYDMRKR